MRQRARAAALAMRAARDGAAGTPHRPRPGPIGTVGPCGGHATALGARSYRAARGRADWRSLPGAPARGAGPCQLKVSRSRNPMQGLASAAGAGLLCSRRAPPARERPSAPSSDANACMARLAGWQGTQERPRRLAKRCEPRASNTASRMGREILRWVKYGYVCNGMKRPSGRAGHKSGRRTAHALHLTALELLAAPRPAARRQQRRAAQPGAARPSPSPDALSI